MQTALASILTPLMMSTSLFGADLTPLMMSTSLVGADLTPGDLPQNTKYESSVELVFGCPAPWCFE